MDTLFQTGTYLDRKHSDIVSKDYVGLNFFPSSWSLMLAVFRPGKVLIRKGQNRIGILQGLFNIKS